MPLFATWDDHDFGKNDTDGRLPGRENSRRAFLEYRPIDPAGDGTGGLYTSFRSGPVEVFVLDTRWFAKTEAVPGRADLPTLLGEAQWTWLENALRQSTAPCKVVASSMVWNGRVRPLKTDCWGAYPHEFERFQRVVRESRASGVMLVSGDVHRSRVLVHPTRDAVGYDLVEFVTSPLHARVHSDAAVTGPEVVFDRGVASSFLLLDARASGAGASVTARFVSATGETFHTRVVDAGSLQPRE
jgi:alkaline phosphatase D